jgi:hypothetical protein
MRNVSTKVQASVLGAAAATIALWLISLSGVEVPIEVAGAVTTIIVAVLGYMVPDPRRS